MAEVYPSVGGQPIEKWLAKQSFTQAALDVEVAARAAVAKAILAGHRDQGHAAIEVERGRIDRYLVLNDERGVLAAMSIEFGRQPNENGYGGHDGLFILHTAMGAAVKLKTKGVGRKSRRRKSQRRRA